MPLSVDHTIKTRLLLRPVHSDLGTIRLAGMNQGGVGVGFATNTMRNRSYYSLNYILSGDGFYRDANGLKCAVPAESAVVLFPRIAHACGTLPGEFWDEVWFQFEGPVFDLMRETGILDPKRPVHHAAGKDYWFRRLFSLIPPIHLRAQTPPHVIVAHFAATLTDMLAMHRPAAEPRAEDDWVAQACHLLSDEDEVASGNFAAIAKKLGFSYESFRKKFRTAVGFSPGQFRMDARIDRAAALLHQGRHSIKEIAEKLGFWDEFYFSRAFKRRFKQSPKKFRSNIRGP